MPPGKPGSAQIAKAEVYMDHQESDLRRGLRGVVGKVLGRQLRALYAGDKRRDDGLQ